MDIYDISKKTGVSIATVSRVINGSSNVSEKTRAKVLAAINESGYTPNVFARGLGLNTMKTIGIMCADCSDPYLARAVYYTEEDLRKNGYDAILYCTGYDRGVKSQCMSKLLTKRVDAVILAGSNYVEEDDRLNGYIKDAAKTVPVMIINGFLDAPGVYCAVCDDCTAVYEVTEKLLGSGRKKPLYVYNSLSYSGIRKLRGFKSAVEDGGLAEEDGAAVFVSEAGSVKAAEDAITEYADKGGSFDCVIASDDILAAGALKYARTRGLSVPDQLAVTGYNNSNIAECCVPELTSVDNRLEALCRHCVSSLMELFADGKAFVPKKTVYSCEIVERETAKF